MSESPCYGCEKRELGCHSYCMEFGKWKFRRGINKLKLKKDVDYIFEHTIKRRFDNPYQHPLDQTRRI